MLGAEIPSIKQILNIKNKKKNSYYDEENSIWTSQTASSIKLIIEALKKIENKEIINLWIPDYFCAETIKLFNNNFVKINFYPIENNLEPNWKIIKEQILEKKADIFIFVHYFGVFRDINKAVEFCKKQNAILIEDCAHCLYDYQKIGKKGDFILYSPHKILPVPKGGLIVSNLSTERNRLIFEYLKNLDIIQIKGNEVFWRLKKLIQKVIKFHRSVKFKIEVHYDKVDKNILNNKSNNIDKWSYSILQHYDYKELKKIAYIRRLNLKGMNYILKNINTKIITKISEEEFCPYYAVYSLENLEKDEKKEVIKILRDKGILVMFWPELPLEIKKSKNSDIAKHISENTIVIPIHQDLNIIKIIGKSLSKLKKIRKKYSFIEIDKNNKEKLSEIKNKIDNIPQDYIYGKIRAEYTKDKVKNYLIIQEKNIIGKLQVLELKKYGIKYGIRVNRGPILDEKNNNANTVFEIMESFKKIQGLYPIFWAPNIVINPENFHLAYTYDWKNWSLYGYSSGIIDLRNSKEEIRKNLEGKWRNQLVSSEKKGYIIKKDNLRYKEILQIYLKDQKEKNFKGIPYEILNSLFEKENSPLEIYYVEKNSEIIAFDIIYLQKESGHYLVGWNSNEGRKDYLNNFLLYNITILLKEKGLLYFDLGGIDYINTEEISKFKTGMRPEHYQLMGEFIKF